MAASSSFVLESFEVGISLVFDVMWPSDAIML